MSIRRKIRLGELLVQHNVISEEQLGQALSEQKRSGRKLGRVLADLGFLNESSLHEFLAKHLQVPFVDLKQVRIDREAVKLLPEPLARRYRALVLQQDARGLLVGMADPSDLHAYDELQAKLRQPLRLALVGETEFLRTVDLVYRQTDEIASLAEAVRDELKEGDVDLESLTADEGSPDAPVLRLLQTMFQDAVQARASDIHIEPGDDKLRIRLRVDGVLQEQVIEGKRDRAERISEELARTIVLHGSALSESILREADVMHADTLVALTNDDQVNILSGALAKQLGCSRSLCLVNNPGYANIVRTFGIDAQINPRAITVSRILQHVRRGRIRAVHSVHQGAGEVIEAEALETAPVVGRPLKDLGVAEGVRFGAILRNGKLLIPTGSTRLEARDCAILFAMPDHVREVEQLFRVSLEYF